MYAYLNSYCILISFHLSKRELLLDSLKRDTVFTQFFYVHTNSKYSLASLKYYCSIDTIAILCFVKAF